VHHISPPPFPLPLRASDVAFPPGRRFERVCVLCAAAHGALAAIGVGHRLLGALTLPICALRCPHMRLLRWFCRGCNRAGAPHAVVSRLALLISPQGCAAKLTGAGGGGCAFAVLDERKDTGAQRLQLVRGMPCRCCPPCLPFVSSTLTRYRRNSSWRESFRSSAASSCGRAATACCGTLSRDAVRMMMCLSCAAMQRDHLRTQHCRAHMDDSFWSFMQSERDRDRRSN
jgi:hypothetical protein